MMSLPRAVVCVDNPQDYLPQLNDYSIMIINPNSAPSRIKYLLEKADWSLLITNSGNQYRNGNKYFNERLFWYTSGTTGDSKFCSFSQTQLDIMAAKICSTYDINSNDRYVSIMGLWHAHGQGFYWATQLARCETTFMSVKDIRKMPDYNPTFITAIPDILKVVHDFNFKNLRFIRSASAPLADSLYDALRCKFSVPIIEAFGMTEALSHCFTNPLYGEQRIGTIGLPDGVDVQLIDNHMYLKGPTMFTDSWYDTGDLAEQDNVGYYKIIGRSKDQINIRGIKINPLSLEQQVLGAIPEVNECVIFGTDKLKCIYVGSSNEQRIAKLLTSLGKHCKPSLIKSVDTIPVAPSGKISRSFLNSQF